MALGLSKDVASETAALTRKWLMSPGLLQVEGQACSTLASDFDWICRIRILAHMPDADVAAFVPNVLQSKPRAKHGVDGVDLLLR